YAKAVVENAGILADSLAERGFDIVSGGTDTHLLLADLRPKELTGKAAEQSLERAAMTCNKNAVPFDLQKPTITSGVRLGSPAATSRGFGGDEFRQIGSWIAEVLDGLAADPENNESVEAKVRDEVVALCRRFPIYPDLLDGT
ncbi:MAG: serine hydroxymethyltransferase, partial [Alphaproteobacteria bacterium]|nr:serine hydroxymethyltransferase [Alphaproteobacteria bacterium]